jgi:hypothetical protein
MSWKNVTLGEVCEFKYGKSLPDAKRVGDSVFVPFLLGCLVTLPPILKNGKSSKCQML